MKVMKLALLGTAALAAASVSARADDLSDLKAQIEALNGRIAQLESAPAVPAGFQLMTVSQQDTIVVPSLGADKNYLPKSTTIGVMPTADVPATTNIQWSGFVRAAVVYTKGYNTYDDTDFDLMGRAEATVVGTTDTAVGEVGAKITFRTDLKDGDVGLLGDNGYGDVYVPLAWGWWKMTPELTLGAGYAGSLAQIGFGVDGACGHCYYVDNSAALSVNPGDTTQLRLSYESGPLSFAIAAEDRDNSNAGILDDDASDAIAFSGEVKYTSDTFSAEIAGLYDPKRDELTAADASAAWQIGAGAGFNLGDMANLSFAVATGKNHSDNKWNTVNAQANISLSDTVAFEIGAGYTKVKNEFSQVAVSGGIYWDPVAQLTIGLEAEHGKQNNVTKADTTVTTVDLVTVYRF